jgi:hypothetical protein
VTSEKNEKSGPLTTPVLPLFVVDPVDPLFVDVPVCPMTRCSGCCRTFRC